MRCSQYTESVYQVTGHLHQRKGWPCPPWPQTISLGCRRPNNWRRWHAKEVSSAELVDLYLSRISTTQPVAERDRHHRRGRRATRRHGGRCCPLAWRRARAAARPADHRQGQLRDGGDAHGLRSARPGRLRADAGRRGRRPIAPGRRDHPRQDQHADGQCRRTGQ